MNCRYPLAFFLIVASLAICGDVVAQTGGYPEKPIRLMVTVPPGGVVDATARLIAQNLSASFGQPVLVESRPGANGAIAAVAAAKAPADGYTILLPVSAIVQTLLVEKKPSYSLKELAPVAKIALIPVGLAVPASLPVRTLTDYVAWARANPSRAEFGTTGAGSAPHIMGEMLNQLAGIRMLHVPFSGGQPALAAILGGQISATFAAPGTIGAQEKKGTLRMLAVTAPTRLRDFPHMPTFTEAGYPEINRPGWVGAFVPAQTPRPLVQRLGTEITRIVRLPEVNERIHGFGFVPEPAGPEEFARFVDAEMITWASLIQRANVRLD